jgi:hypothetical protein
MLQDALLGDVRRRGAIAVDLAAVLDCHWAIADSEAAQITPKTMAFLIFMAPV